MPKFNDFDLDYKVTETGNGNIAESKIRSKSLCTPGCITGILQTCPLQTATCGCHITGK
ncbi:MAG: hypothetical protein K0R23_625 [Lacrimispora sp.]|jgi:gallidermin/nisin family lantibiotic|nr:hypothetical protein [Lacrimispora sp.]